MRFYPLFARPSEEPELATVMVGQPQAKSNRHIRVQFITTKAEERTIGERAGERADVETPFEAEVCSFLPEVRVDGRQLRDAR